MENVRHITMARSRLVNCFFQFFIRVVPFCHDFVVCVSLGYAHGQVLVTLFGVKALPPLVPPGRWEDAPGEGGSALSGGSAPGGGEAPCRDISRFPARRLPAAPVHQSPPAWPGGFGILPPGEDGGGENGRFRPGERRRIAIKAVVVLNNRIKIAVQRKSNCSKAHSKAGRFVLQVFTKKECHSSNYAKHL